jgi:hypothetical protein
MLLLKPNKLELFIAGILISSVVMDSPLWGAMKLWHGLPLWHVDGKNNFAKTSSLGAWIADHYNPIGKNPVWEASWPIAGLPTSAMIFWGFIAKICAAAALIWLQARQEAAGKQFSLKQLLLTGTS